MDRPFQTLTDIELNTLLGYLDNNRKRDVETFLINRQINFDKNIHTADAAREEVQTRRQEIQDGGSKKGSKKKSKKRSKKGSKKRRVNKKKSSKKQKK